MATILFYKKIKKLNSATCFVGLEVALKYLGASLCSLKKLIHWIQKKRMKKINEFSKGERLRMLCEVAETLDYL